MREISQLELEKEQIIETSDWLTSQAKEIDINRRLNELKLNESKIKDYDKKIQEIKEYRKRLPKRKLIPQNKGTDEKAEGSDIEDDNILIEDSEIALDYQSDEEKTEVHQPTKVIQIPWYRVYNEFFL